MRDEEDSVFVLPVRTSVRISTIIYAGVTALMIYVLLVAVLVISGA